MKAATLLQVHLRKSGRESRQHTLEPHQPLSGSVLCCPQDSSTWETPAMDGSLLDRRSRVAQQLFFRVPLASFKLSGSKLPQGRPQRHPTSWKASEVQRNGESQLTPGAANMRWREAWVCLRATDVSFDKSEPTHLDPTSQHRWSFSHDTGNTKEQALGFCHLQFQLQGRQYSS